MGGDLVAASEGIPGRGTSFRLSVPLQVAGPEDVPEVRRRLRPRAVRLAPDQPRRRLLVVDDSEPSRLLLVRILTGLGFEVESATNGLEGLRTWESWRPHLIWMDMRMPVMDGHEATQRIKATTQGQATTVIALTASVFEDQRVLVLSEGCDDFVRKPVRLEDIEDRLVKYLGVRFLYEEVLPPVPRGPTCRCGLRRGDACAGLEECSLPGGHTRRSRAGAGVDRGDTPATFRPGRYPCRARRQLRL